MDPDQKLRLAGVSVTVLATILIPLYFPISEWIEIFLVLSVVFFVADMVITASFSRFGIPENSTTLTYRLCGENPSLRCMVKRGIAILGVAGLVFWFLLFSSIPFTGIVAALILVVATVGGAVITAINLSGIAAKIVD